MTSTAAEPLAPARVRSATTATYVAFAGSGFAVASWASRILAVKQHFALTPSSVGLVLLSIAAGSVVALPLAGPLVSRVGSRRAVQAMAALLGLALLVVAVGYRAGLPVVVVGLALLGYANGTWDVAMNVQGAVVERHLRRSIMSRFHAGFSLGTVVGALVGAGAVRVGLPVPVHLAVVGVLVAAAVAAAVRGFVADHDGATVDDTTPASSDAVGTAAAPRGGALDAWREPRTLLVGLCVLAFAFAEGAGNDWVSIAVTSAHLAGPAVATLTFALFLAAMTAGRWFGTGALDRWGRVPVVRVLGVVALVGVVLFATGQLLAVAVVGVLAWGLGASLGFPVGMSAAADDPARAASRVSVVASIGYCAFLGGPPLVGFLADRVGTSHALLAVAVLLLAATLVIGALRPRTGGAGTPASSVTPARG